MDNLIWQSVKNDVKRRIDILLTEKSRLTTLPAIKEAIQGYQDYNELLSQNWTIIVYGASEKFPVVRISSDHITTPSINSDDLNDVYRKKLGKRIKNGVW